MNIGILSGSFNPIHIGHLILGNYITEFTEIEEVWYLVSPQNPLKIGEEMVDEQTRLTMVRLALEDYPKLIPSDFEFALPKPSYTINTLEALSTVHPEDRFNLIIGADNWLVFDKWKDHQKIIANYGIKVYPRLGYNIANQDEYSNIELLQSPVIDISSTFIRQAIREGKNMKPMLPKAVDEYISTRNLYEQKNHLIK